jgi:hypothetical protein
MPTKLTHDKPVTRETVAEYRGKPLIVELHPGFIAIRQKRGQDSYMVAYGDLYEYAQRVEALERKNSAPAKKTHLRRG